jgi:hypothetical protein
MCNRLIAIAGLVIRAAVRSRMLICLGGLLILIVVGLPLTIKGDGALASEVKILLRYTLGLSSIVLAVMTLWASCGAVSREVAEKQIRLVTVKPVRPIEIWLGKWLGLLVLDAVLLIAVAFAVYGSVCRKLNSFRATAHDRAVVRDEILVGHRQVLPRAEAVQAEARQRLNRLTEQGRIAAGDAVRERVLPALERQILGERSTVPPGKLKRWRFVSLPPCGGETPVFLQFRLSPSVGDKGPAFATWRVGTRSSPDLVSFSQSNRVSNTGRLAVPAGVLGRGEPVTVSFLNGPPPQAGTVVFDLDRPVELLIRQSGFEANFGRAVVVIFCHLAFLAALGLTAGSLFSPPVATFLASSLVFIAVMGHYVTLQHDAGLDMALRPADTSQASSFFHTVGAALVRRMEFVVEPVAGLEPLEPMSDGYLVTWDLTCRAILLLIFIYPGCLGLVAWLAIRRRELALPG